MGPLKLFLGAFTLAVWVGFSVFPRSADAVDTASTSSVAQSIPGQNTAQSIAALTALAAFPQIEAEIKRCKESGVPLDVQKLTEEIAKILASTAKSTANSTAIWMQMAGAGAAGWMTKGLEVPRGWLASRLAHQLIGYFHFLGWEFAAAWKNAASRRILERGKRTNNPVLIAKAARMERPTELLTDMELLGEFAEELGGAVVEDHGIRDIALQAMSRWASVSLLTTYGALSLGSAVGGGVMEWIASRLLTAAAGARAGRVGGWIGATVGAGLAILAREQPGVAEIINDIDLRLLNRDGAALSRSYAAFQLEIVAGPKGKDFYGSEGLIHEWNRDRELVEREGIQGSVKVCERLDEARHSRGTAIKLEFEEVIKTLKPRVPEIVDALDAGGDRAWLQRFIDGDIFVTEQVGKAIERLSELDHLIRDLREHPSQGMWPIQRADHVDRAPDLLGLGDFDRETLIEMYRMKQGEVLEVLRPLGLGQEVTVYRPRDARPESGPSFREITLRDYLSSITPEQIAQYEQEAKDHPHIPFRARLAQDAAKRRATQVGLEATRDEVLERAKSAARARLKVLDKRSEALTARRYETEMQLSNFAQALRDRQLTALRMLGECARAIWDPTSPCGANATRKMAAEEIVRQMDDIYRSLALIDQLLDWKGAGSSPERDRRLKSYLGFLLQIEANPLHSETDLAERFTQQQRASDLRRSKELLEETTSLMDQIVNDYRVYQEYRTRNFNEDVRGEVLKEALKDEKQFEDFSRRHGHAARLRALAIELGTLVMRDPMAELNAAIPQFPATTPIVLRVEKALPENPAPQASDVARPEPAPVASEETQPAPRLRVRNRDRNQDTPDDDRYLQRLLHPGRRGPTEDVPQIFDGFR